jgi:hypothetical protein
MLEENVYARTAFIGTTVTGSTRSTGSTPLAAGVSDGSRIGQPFTPDEDAELYALRGARMSWSAVAKAMGRSCGTVCRLRHIKLEERRLVERQAAARAAQGRERACMTCGTAFLSQHAGNRMCDPCRELPRGADLEPW